MELPELKGLWQVSNSTLIDQYKINADEVHALLQQKSESIISKIKRSLLTKIIVAGISGIVSVGLGVVQLVPLTTETFILKSLLTQRESGLMLTILGVVISGVVVGNIYNYKKVIAFEKSSLSIKNCISGVLRVIKNVSNLVIFSDVIFTPLAAGLVGYIFFYQRGSFSIDFRLILLLLIVSGAVINSLIINRWVLKRRFGRNINKLKKCLLDLEVLEN